MTLEPGFKVVNVFGKKEGSYGDFDFVLELYSVVPPHM
jgi:hypothetical protein